MKTIVKVTGAPHGFPWENGVLVNLIGDTKKLDVLIKELNEVRKMVNADVNRAGLALRDVNVTIEVKA